MWILNPEMLWQPSQQKYKIGVFFFKASSYSDYWDGIPTFSYLSDYPLVHLFMDSYYFLPLKFKVTFEQLLQP